MASCASAGNKVDNLKSAKKCLACGRLNAVAKKRCACGSEFVSRWKSILKETPVVLTPERLRSKVLNDGYQSSLGVCSDTEVSDSDGLQISSKDSKLNASISDFQNEIGVEVSIEKLYPKPKRIRKIKYDSSFDLYDRNLITAQKASVDSYNQKLLNDKKLKSFILNTSAESSKEELVSLTSSSTFSSSKSSIFEIEDNKNISSSETTQHDLSNNSSFASKNEFVTSPNIDHAEENLSVTSPHIDHTEENLEKSSHDKNIDTSLTRSNKFKRSGRRPIGRPRKHVKLNMPKRAVGRPRKDGKVSDKMSYYQRKKAEKLRIKSLELEIANISEHHKEEIDESLNPKLTFRTTEPNQPNVLHRINIWENKFIKKRGRPKGSRDTRPRQKKKLLTDYNDYGEYESALGKVSSSGSLNMASPKKARCLLSPPSLISSIIRKQKNMDTFEIKDNDKSERKQEKEDSIPEDKKEIFSLILDEINRKIISQKCFL